MNDVYRSTGRAALIGILGMALGLVGCQKQPSQTAPETQQTTSETSEMTGGATQQTTAPLTDGTTK